MTINIGNFANERNCFPKNYTWILTLNGNLKNPANIKNPTILVECENPSAYNYLYIPSFNRYYFIENCVSVRSGLWEISCKCDVLQTYSTQIKGNSGIVLRQKNMRSKYLTDNKIALNSTMRVRLKAFNYTFAPQKLLLVVAGGGN